MGVSCSEGCIKIVIEKEEWSTIPDIWRRWALTTSQQQQCTGDTGVSSNYGLSPMHAARHRCTLHKSRLKSSFVLTIYFTVIDQAWCDPMMRKSIKSCSPNNDREDLVMPLNDSWNAEKEDETQLAGSQLFRGIYYCLRFRLKLPEGLKTFVLVISFWLYNRLRS